MASQSLYRKWRSQTFDEMVGQESIIRTLKNALNTNNLGHAYLFTGPRGTGKTTTARLLAKTVNCLNSQNGEPCNDCQQCSEITAGTSFNVIEIDAASNRGIDSIRELREKVMMPPSTGKYKIYILDEAHMLTTEAFNALLKTLEEPPDYAIFVMATTDVHKMLPTVLSRCQRFDFKRISTNQIIQHLLFVAKEEGVEVERSAAALIARTAAGGMRDALSLLDQAIAYSGNGISLAQVQAMLGVADPRAISKLIEHIAGLASPALLYLIHELSEAGADLRQLNSQVVEYWRALMLAKAGADIATILDLTDDEVAEIQSLLPAFTLEELTECARIFAQNDLMQKNQGTPQLGLELASLECIELHRRTQAGQFITQPARSAVISSPAADAAASRKNGVSAASPAQHSASPVARREEPEVEPTRPVVREDVLIESMRIARQEVPSQVIHVSPDVPEQVQAALTLQQVAAAWENVKKRTRQKSPPLATYIGMCDLLGVESDNENTIIVIRAAKPAHHKFIREEDRPKEVEWALSMEFSLACKLRVLGPDQPYTGSAASVSYSLSAVSTRPSAHLERPASSQASPSRASAPAPTHYASTQTSPSRASAPAPIQHAPAFSAPSASHDVLPLARVPEVSENKKIALSKEEAQQKANEHPVVQEVIKMFRATLEDIQPK
jgi:DNA polymerase-3 subunit gamma/tau